MKKGSIFLFTVLLTLLPLSVLFSEDVINTDEDSLFSAPSATDSSGSGGQDVQSNQNGSSGQDESSLFSSGEAGLVSTPKESDKQLSNDLLTGDKTVIGGKYEFVTDLNWRWNDISTFIPDIANWDSVSVPITVKAQTFLDARPSADFRFFTKLSLSYPFTESGSRTFNDIFNVDEMFADFNWKDSLFFRAGVQTLNWGVGYFFSPANLLNVSKIDPEDPDADRQGPLALSVNYPFGVHNLYGYILEKDVLKPEDFGLAVKGEFVIGGVEFSAGALYRHGYAPAAMLTATGNAGDFRLFGEAVLHYGSDRHYVVEDSSQPLGANVVQYTDKLYFSGTAGASYFHSNDAQTFNFSATGQYYFNGPGYKDAGILQEKKAAVLSFLQSGDLTADDLMETGRHYAALSAALTDIAKLHISTRVFWMQNFSDMSGIVIPSFSWQPIDPVILTLKVPMTYGDSGDELSGGGNTIGVTLEFSLGGGSF